MPSKMTGKVRVAVETAAWVLSLGVAVTAVLAGWLFDDPQLSVNVLLVSMMLMIVALVVGGRESDRDREPYYGDADEDEYWNG